MGRDSCSWRRGSACQQATGIRHRGAALPLPPGDKRRKKNLSCIIISELQSWKIPSGSLSPEPVKEDPVNAQPLAPRPDIQTTELSSSSRSMYYSWPGLAKLLFFGLQLPELPSQHSCWPETRNTTYLGDIFQTPPGHLGYWPR